jgi:hypothetical protein
MRLGGSVLVFSKTAKHLSIGLLSKRLLIRSGSKKLLAPIVAYSYTTEGAIAVENGLNFEPLTPHASQ